MSTNDEAIPVFNAELDPLQLADDIGAGNTGESARILTILQQLQADMQRINRRLNTLERIVTFRKPA